jgi:hypothetical protein
MREAELSKGKMSTRRKPRPTRRIHTDLDYTQDAGDRLTGLIASLATARQLEPSARTAGQMLERLTPGLCAAGPCGAAAIEAANTREGAFLVVLADAKRAGLVGCVPASRHATPKAIEQMIQAADEDGAPSCGWTRAAVDIINTTLDHYGARPGDNMPDLGDRGPYVLGAMFAMVPSEPRTRLAKAIDVLREHSICPAVVGLIGPASSGRDGLYPVAWPLLLPVAPYAEHVLRNVEANV